MSLGFILLIHTPWFHKDLHECFDCSNHLDPSAAELLCLQRLNGLNLGEMSYKGNLYHVKLLFLMCITDATFPEKVLSSSNAEGATAESST